MKTVTVSNECSPNVWQGNNVKTIAYINSYISHPVCHNRDNWVGFSEIHAQFGTRNKMGCFNDPALESLWVVGWLVWGGLCG